MFDVGTASSFFQPTFKLINAFFETTNIFRLLSNCIVFCRKHFNQFYFHFRCAPNILCTAFFLTPKVKCFPLTGNEPFDIYFRKCGNLFNHFKRGVALSFAGYIINNGRSNANCRSEGTFIASI